jgi:hypothetical protein
LDVEVDDALEISEQTGISRLVVSSSRDDRRALLHAVVHIVLVGMAVMGRALSFGRKKTVTRGDLWPND